MLTWSEFQTIVNNMLSVESTRRGTEAFRDQYMRNAVMDLQRFIRGYRTNNVSVYTANDVSPQSAASLGQLPSGARPKAFWIYSNLSGDDPNCKRYRLDPYPWNRRQDLLCGALDYSSWWAGCCGTNCLGQTPPPNPPPAGSFDWCHGKAYVFSISPYGNNFLCYPPITASKNLLVVWDGLKIDFNSGDIITLPEEAGEAVADYIMWKLSLRIDKNPILAAASEKMYYENRLKLFRDEREKTQADSYTEDEEYLGNLQAPPVESQVLGGLIATPFLGQISQIQGTTPISLCNLPTVNLTAPADFAAIIAGTEYTCALTAGTNPTNPALNQYQPNDYNSATNAKYWQLTVVDPTP